MTVEPSGAKRPDLLSVAGSLAGPAQVGMHRGIQPIEVLVQPQRMKYLTALDDSLAHRSAEATALLAHFSLLARARDLGAQ